MKQKPIELKGKIFKSTSMVGDINTPMSTTDRTTKQKISKGIEELSNTMQKMNLIDIFRVLCLTEAEHTLFLSTHGTYTKIDHILGH